MPTSNRVLSGSTTRGSKSTPVGVESISGKEFDEQRQGINLRDLADQSSSLFAKIRPNSSEIRTRNGKDLSSVYFDESIATVNVLSASSYVSTVNIGSVGRLSTRLSHKLETLDLGQTHIYDDGLPYYDTQNIDPVHIVSNSPFNVELPPALADHNSMSSMDGTIDVFSIRKKIDRSSLESPFFSKGLYGTFGAVEDSHRRSNQIHEGINSNTNKITEKYLDSSEAISIVVNGTLRAFPLPGFHSDEVATVEPFVDIESGRHDFYKKTSVDNEIQHVLVNVSTSSLNNYQTHDKMALTGYRYENNNIGIDSIAFGGLLK